MRLAIGLFTAARLFFRVTACGGDSATGPEASTRRPAIRFDEPAFDMSGGNAFGDQVGEFHAHAGRRIVSADGPVRDQLPAELRVRS